MRANLQPNLSSEASTLKVICLWGKRRGVAIKAKVRPSNTDKGVRELRKLNVEVDDVNVDDVYVWMERFFLPKRACLLVAFLVSACSLFFKCLGKDVVIYTSNYPWVRVVAFMKRMLIIRSRLVIRWTANDIDYSSLLNNPSVQESFRKTMRHVDACWVVSERERDFWRKALPELSERFAFWPTPVDIDFYSSRVKSLPGEFRGRVVAVGSDYKRDWHLPIELARRGVPVTLLTEDASVVKLVESAGVANCQLLYRIGFDRSADVLADAGVILLATKENDRFSGSTTVGVAAALGRPLMLDEPYDLASYCLFPGINCVSFERSNVDNAFALVSNVLNNFDYSEVLAVGLYEQRKIYSMQFYANELRRSMKSGWSAAEVAWPPHEVPRS